MNVRHWSAIAAACCALAFAQSPDPQKPPGKPGVASTDTAPAAAPAPPVYKPPARGTPQRRVGGASRGIGSRTASIAVIAPDHVGLTLREQPDLYWFISTPSRVRIELTLVEEAGRTTVKELVLDGIASAGIHRFSLAEQGVRLAQGTDHQWSVALVPDPDSRSGDLVSAGGLRRIVPDAALAGRLGGPPSLLAGALAEAGIWYDAFAQLSAQVEASPADRAAREARARLLDQVGLEEAARFERR